MGEIHHSKCTCIIAGFDVVAVVMRTSLAGDEAPLVRFGPDKVHLSDTRRSASIDALVRMSKADAPSTMLAFDHDPEVGLIAVRKAIPE